MADDVQLPANVSIHVRATGKKKKKDEKFPQVVKKIENVMKLKQGKRH